MASLATRKAVSVESHLPTVAWAGDGLTVKLVQAYLDACKEARQEPDAEMLDPIVEKFKELQESEEQE